MDWFSKALVDVLEHEGGSRFTDDPVDPGGATKWGISLRFLRAEGHDIDGDGDIDADDIRALSQEDAAALYRECFWDKFRCNAIQNYDVAAKLFDTAVNVGPRAVRFLQEAVNRVHGVAILEVDGKLGAVTMAHVNACNQETLLTRMCEVQAAFYLSLIKARPALGKYRNGWLKRAKWRP